MEPQIKAAVLTSDNRALSDASKAADENALAVVGGGALTTLADRTRAFISVAKAPAASAPEEAIGAAVKLVEVVLQAVPDNLREYVVAQIIDTLSKLP